MATVNQDHVDYKSSHVITDTKPTANASARDPRASTSSSNVSSDSEDIPVPQGTGIAKIEKITASWSKPQLWITISLIFFLMVVQSLSNQTLNQLAVYATSDYGKHSLLPVLSILSSIVTAVIALPLAKVLDVFGRPEALAVVGLLDMLGNIITASSRNIDTYFGAHVIFSIGESSIAYIVTILVSDMTSLRNRLFYLALVNTPFIVTSWIGAPIADSLVHRSTWRWGYGIFAILIPVAVGSLCAVLFWNQRRARQQKIDVGEDARQEQSPKAGSGPKRALSLLRELDLIGLLLLAAGFCLLLLAVTLAKSNGSTWRSAHIIVMLVIGPLCIIAFVLWEKFGATRPIVGVELLTNRTILSAALCSAVMRAAFFMWDNFYSSHLQVVNGLSITQAGYIANIYNVVSCLWGPFLGLIVKRFNNVKIVALCMIPIHLLGAGLMIKYRTEDSPIVAIVWCQILIAAGGGSLVLLEQLAVMSVVTHDRIASALAFKSLVTYLGGSIGSAVAGAVWTNTMLNRVSHYLPDDKKSLAPKIYSSITVQLKYARGTPERTAITYAYEDTQRILTITATCLVAVGTIFVFMWRHVRLSENKQIRGNVL